MDCLCIKRENFEIQAETQVTQVRPVPNNGPGDLTANKHIQVSDTLTPPAQTVPRCLLITCPQVRTLALLEVPGRTLNLDLHPWKTNLRDYVYVSHNAI